MKEQNELEQKLAGSLTAETTELLPFLPYLLQDIWELGSNPRDMVHLIRHNADISGELRIIDLGCGKGAVTVSCCKELGARVKGIDLLPDFIKEAREKAALHEVTHLCEFVVQDINEAVKTEREYDIAILGAVGDVLGSPEETLAKLKGVVHSEGYILIDEAYLEGEQDEVRYKNYEYLTLAQWKRLFSELNLELIAEMTCESSAEADAANAYNNQKIRKRADELAAKYPDKKELFEGYVKSQEMECDDLKDVIIGVTWLLKRLS